MTAWWVFRKSDENDGLVTQTGFCRLAWSSWARWSTVFFAVCSFRATVSLLDRSRLTYIAPSCCQSGLISSYCAGAGWK